jgi:xanthine dehydrogenase small subunit
MARDAIRFLRRGRIVEVRDVHPRTTVLDWLRLQERSLGTKEGCGEGDCGACTVAIGRLRRGRLVYEPVNACILMLGQIDGCELVTVEDLAADGELHPVQAAMVAHHGSQCGFCTPGIVMSLFTFYQHGERPVTREAACDALAGNLCRCTGYRPIIDAALEACASEPHDVFVLHRDHAQTALEALADGEDLVCGVGEAFYAAPVSEEGLAALALDHPDATLLAGATDVGLWVTKQLANLDQVIGLGRVSGLDVIESRPEGLAIGAMVSLARVAPHLAAMDRDLGELMRRFGSAQVRASGTVGGNIANGSPIGDLAPALIALDATLELRRGERVRSMPLEEFFIAYRRQDREPGEFVRRVLVPRPGPDDHVRVFKVTKRFDEDISAVMMACRITVSGGVIADARIAYGGMAGTPKRAAHVEAALIGSAISEGAAWRRASDELPRDFTPMDDHRASASYRMQVGRNLIIKALAEIAGAPSFVTRVAGRREVPRAAE